MSDTFDKVAGIYRGDAAVQRDAGEKLIGMLDLRGDESVLDGACGPGHLTERLSRMTSGRVVGIDISAAMIEEASRHYPSIEFAVEAAEDFRRPGEFDVVYCNSALQWFSDGPRAVKAMSDALEPGGRLALACPATRDFAPRFLAFVAAAAKRPDVGPTFSHWQNPWFQLEDFPAYVSLFEEVGLETLHAAIEHESQEYPVDQAYGVYFSGAANGFAGKAFYDVQVDDAYVERFNAAVREEMEKSSRGGLVTIDFNRLYYIGRRP